MTGIEAYNLCSSAAVHEDRKMLARGLRAARRAGGEWPKKAFWHATYVGWPVRKRPNGRFN